MFEAEGEGVGCDVAFCLDVIRIELCQIKCQRSYHLSYWASLCRYAQQCWDCLNFLCCSYFGGVEILQEVPFTHENALSPVLAWHIRDISQKCQPCIYKILTKQPHITMENTVSKSEAEARAQRRAESMRLLKLDSRLSFPFGVRLPVATTLSFISGMALGITHGSQMAGLQFRAENAHRLPQTTTGWYLYHKTKNYRMALGGVKEGMKMGAKLSFWVAGFFGIEEIFDQWRGTKDFVNTTIASLAVAGVFSLYSIFLSSKHQ